jgi:hypothetical protein
LPRHGPWSPGAGAGFRIRGGTDSPLRPDRRPAGGMSSARARGRRTTLLRAAGLER